MEKNTAEVLNGIPVGMELNDYFNTLDIFQKRELINEIKEIAAFWVSKFKKMFPLAILSYVVSFLCYFGTDQSWAGWYLFAINVPLTVILVLHYIKAYKYTIAAKILEHKLID
jgi:hypothetical protein